MSRAPVSRRAALAGLGAAALGACQPEDLKLSGLNPLARKQFRRQIDEALASPRKADGMQARRRNDLGEVLASGIGGFASTPALETYVNDVLARVAAPVAEWGMPLQAYVMADAQVGAFAYPSGAIFVTDGMLRGVRSEDELAFVLGHEVGHIAMGHHTSDWVANLRRYSVLAVETGVALRGAVGGGTQGSSIGLLAATYAGAIVSRDFVSPSWTRDQEDQADRFATDLLVRAGFNVEAAYEVMDLLKAAEQNFGKEGAVEYTALEEALHGQSAQVKSEAAKGNVVASSFAALGDAVSGMLSESRRNHRTATERVEVLRKYAEAEYDDAPAPAYRTGPLAAALSQPATRTVLGRYDAVRDLVRRGDGAVRDPRARARQLTDLAAGPTASDSYMMLRLAWLRSAEGPAATERQLLPALADPRPGVEPFYNVAQLRGRSGRFKEGLAALDKAAEFYGEPGAALMNRIALQVAAGDNAGANATLIRCQIERPELAGACRKAMAPGAG